MAGIIQVTESFVQEISLGQGTTRGCKGPAHKMAENLNEEASCVSRSVVCSL